MTSLPPHDPFIALWQTTPKPDTQSIVQDLQRLTKLHQRLNRMVLAIMVGIALLLIFEEKTGRLTTDGVLSIMWTLGLVIGVVWHRRARCYRSDAITWDTVHLLEWMIAKARSDLFVARCLYAGVPGGAAAGLVVAKIASIGAPLSALAVSAPLQRIQTGAGVGALLIMIGTGTILARTRRLQAQKLSEKLRRIKDDL